MSPKATCLRWIPFPPAVQGTGDQLEGAFGGHLGQTWTEDRFSEEKAAGGMLWTCASGTTTVPLPEAEKRELPAGRHYGGGAAPGMGTPTLPSNTSAPFASVG